MAVQVSAIHRETAEQPSNMLGIEVDDRIQSRRECLAAGGFAEHSRCNLTIAQRSKAVDADLLHDDVLTRETEPLQRQRRRRIAFRTRAADADDAAFQIR